LGNEIIKQLNGKKIDALVAGVGTGGTLIGVGKALRKKFPKVKIFALEPDECHILADYGIGSVSQINKKTLACKTHKIEGIGDGIVPEIIKRDQEMISGVIEIKSKEAIKMSVKLKKQGYFVGTSSGANFLGALKLKKQGFKNIVTFFCDSGDRYLD
jgi:cysteine synthase